MKEAILHRAWTARLRHLVLLLGNLGSPGGAVNRREAGSALEPYGRLMRGKIGGQDPVGEDEA